MEFFKKNLLYNGGIIKPKRNQKIDKFQAIFCMSGHKNTYLRNGLEIQLRAFLV